MKNIKEKLNSVLGGEGRRNLSGRSEITAKSWPVFVSHRIPSTLPLIFLQDLIAPHPIFTPPPPPTFSYPHFCQIFVLHRIPSASHPILDLIFLFFLFLQKQKKTWLFGFGENVYGWTLGPIGKYCHRWYSTPYHLITYLFIPSQSEYPLVQGCWWWTWPGGERLTSAPCSIARGTPTNGALPGLSLLILLKLPLPSPVRWSHKCHLDCQKPPENCCNCQRFDQMTIPQ